MSRIGWNKFQFDILKTGVFSYIAHLDEVVFTKKPVRIFWLLKSKNGFHHRHFQGLFDLNSLEPQFFGTNDPP